MKKKKKKERKALRRAKKGPQSKAQSRVDKLKSVKKKKQAIYCPDRKNSSKKEIINVDQIEMGTKSSNFYDYFFDNVLEICEQHGKINVIKDSDLGCVSCHKIKTVDTDSLLDLFTNWKSKIDLTIQDIVAENSVYSGITEKYTDLMAYRNRGLRGMQNVTGKPQQKKVVVEDLLVDINALQNGALLVSKLFELHNSIDEDKIRSLSVTKQSYSLESLTSAVTLYLKFEYNCHILQNDLAICTFIPLETVFSPSTSLYSYIIENELYLQRDGGKYWYYILYTPTYERLNQLNSFFGAFNRKEKHLDMLQEVDGTEDFIPSISAAMTRSTSSPDLSLEYNQTDLTLLGFTQQFHSGLCPNKFYADLFSTKKLDLNHQELYRLRDLINYLYTKHPQIRINNIAGMIRIEISSFKKVLDTNDMGHLFDVIIKQGSIGIPYYLWYQNADPRIQSPIEFINGQKNRDLMIEKYCNGNVNILVNPVPMAFLISDFIYIDSSMITAYALEKVRFADVYSTYKTRLGEVFENSIVPNILIERGFEFIVSDLIKLRMKKVNVRKEEKAMQIDGIMLDNENKTVYVTEIKTIAPDPNDIYSIRSLAGMVAKFLVEDTGHKLGKLTGKSDKITFIEKKGPNSMAERTAFIEKYWKILDLTSTNISGYSFSPLIITDAPGLINNKTRKALGYPVICLQDILSTKKLFNLE